MMTDSSTTILSDRSIRDLVMPEYEQPPEDGTSANDRRHGHRYARRLRGVLVFNGAEHQVQCRDISYSGMHITAAPAIRPTAGQYVEVRIPVGPRIYRDSFRVVETESVQEGTAIHLSL
jgi:hypothetical protein